MNNGRQKTLNKCKEVVDLRIYFKVAVMLAMLLLFLLEVRLVSAIKKIYKYSEKNFFKTKISTKYLKNEAAFETVIKFYVHEHLGKSELGEMERREDEHHWSSCSCWGWCNLSTLLFFFWHWKSVIISLKARIYCRRSCILRSPFAKDILMTTSLMRSSWTG